MVNHFLEYLKNTIKLDIYKINVKYGWEPLDFISFPAESLPRPGILIRISSFLTKCFISLFHTNDWDVKKIPCSDPIFCFETINQWASLKPIADKLNNAVLVNISSSNKFDKLIGNRFPVALAYLYSLFFFPLTIIKFISSKGYQRKGFRYAFDTYWLLYGYYLVACIWLQKVKPSVLVFSNDHNALPHAIMQAGKDKGIPTIYIQHASVTDKFPPLDFTYAFLDGRDALDKYNRAGRSITKVILIGMAKADICFYSLNKNTVVNKVGICTAPRDPLPRGEELCQELRKSNPDLSYILRPHPEDRRINTWKKFANQYGMQFSDPKKELVFDYLNRVDVIIAGDSGILLEAALVNVYPFYYDFRVANLDYYGFEHNGLVERFSTPKTLIDRLTLIKRNKSEVRSRTKYFCASVGTKFEGHSSELAARLIGQISKNGQIDLSEWKRISNIALESFELGEFSG